MPGYRSEKGQSLLELAIGVILLILLVSGLVDLGRIFLSYIALQEGTQEGALYGAVNASDTLGIISKVRTSSDSPVNLGDASSVSVAVSTIGPACEESTLRVSATYSFQFVTPLVDLVTGFATMPITATAYATILTPPCP